jgi:dTMP kinase
VGLLVAIEGIDGTGKGTQARRLVDALTAAGRRTRLIGFPRYSETSFGRRIGDYLNGRYGSLDAVHPLLAAMLYAGDRFESCDLLRQSIADCDVVVLDRYIASNIAHQAAKRSGPERDDLRAFIEQLEFGTYELPRADLVILLDLPAVEAQRLIAKKAQRDYTDRAADLQEENAAYLEAVRQMYLQLAADSPDWRRIDVLRGGEIRSIDNVAAEIRAVVQKKCEEFEK